MNDGNIIARLDVIIVNAYGLHMRPSSKFVKTASAFSSEVTVRHGGKTVNGKSILEMTSLAAECGTMLELEAQGTDAHAALEALAQLVAAGFHMEDEEG